MTPFGRSESRHLTSQHSSPPAAHLAFLVKQTNNLFDHWSNSSQTRHLFNHWSKTVRRGTAFARTRCLFTRVCPPSSTRTSHISRARLPPHAAARRRSWRRWSTCRPTTRCATSCCSAATPTVKLRVVKLVVKIRMVKLVVKLRVVKLAVKLCTTPSAATAGAARRARGSRRHPAAAGRRVGRSGERRGAGTSSTTTRSGAGPRPRRPSARRTVGKRSRPLLFSHPSPSPSSVSFRRIHGMRWIDKAEVPWTEQCEHLASRMLCSSALPVAVDAAAIKWTLVGVRFVLLRITPFGF